MNEINTTGIVSSNGDKAGAGRISVAVKQTDGQTYPELFDPVSLPGFFSPPEPGDAVEVVMPDTDDMVEFAHEVRYRGQIFDETHPPPTDFKQRGSKVTRRGYFTRGGHRLIFEDYAGDESIIIKEGKAGHTVTLHGGDGVVTIENGTSGSKITMAADGTVEIEADKVHIKAPDTELSDTVTDAVIKGTTAHAAMTAYTASITAALATWSATFPATPVSNGAFIAAHGAANATLAASLSGWLSTKVKTG